MICCKAARQRCTSSAGGQRLHFGCFVATTSFAFIFEGVHLLTQAWLCRTRSSQQFYFISFYFYFFSSLLYFIFVVFFLHFLLFSYLLFYLFIRVCPTHHSPVVAKVLLLYVAYGERMFVTFCWHNSPIGRLYRKWVLVPGHLQSSKVNKKKKLG